MAKAKKPVNIDGVEFDALLDEERTFSADAPDYPVEDGFSVSDTIILKPLELAMTLLLSDAPVTWKSSGHGGIGWTQEVVAKLEKLYYNKTPVTVTTSERTYKNMAILSFSIAKSLEAGYARHIPITFREIRVTQSKTTTIPDSYGKGGATGANAGVASQTVSNTPPGSGNGADENQSKSSMLYSLAKAGGLLK